MVEKLPMAERLPMVEKLSMAEKLPMVENFPSRKSILAGFVRMFFSVQFGSFVKSASNYFGKV